MAESGRGAHAVPYLRAWRVHRAFSQVQLAQASGVSVAAISRVEAAPDALMLLATIRRLALALAIRPDQLWTEPPPDGGGVA